MTGETERSYRAAPGVAVPVARVRTTARRRQERRGTVARYIGRWLQIATESGRDVKYTEDDFFSARGPLVVLGDPGVGKSRLVEQFCKKSGTETCVNAISLPMYQSSQHLLREEVFPRKTVIDEVDAVTAGDPRKIVEKVLAHLGHFRAANFVLVCRSVDWVEASRHAIKDRWSKVPTIGTLLPLDESGIVQFADDLDPELGGAEFLAEAQRRGLGPLLGNPQLLRMLLETAEDGWPESKSDLYENVCRKLAREKNQTHKQLAGKRTPGVDTLCDASGFVFAQLLLSGTEGVADNGSDRLPDADDLSSDAHSKSDVASAIATNLFHAKGGGVFVPHHRTIAEYLAAKWLSESLEKPGLRIRDLEALLRVSNDKVPSSTRGVHAWVASLSECEDARNQFIRRDPYGFWCYGDRDQLSDDEAVELVDALSAHAQRDPGFHDGNRRLNFGGWPKTDRLLRHIADRIHDRNTPPGMVRLLVESIHDNHRSRHLEEALKSLVLDTSAPNRILCLISLARHMRDADLNKTVERLLDMADVGSICVANSAILHHPGRINGKTIARALADSGAHTEYLGLGQHEIYERLSAQKARACLDETMKIAGGPDATRAFGAQRATVSLLDRLFESEAPPTPAVLWECLTLVGPPRDFENDSDGGILGYLAKHDEYRRKTQAIAISEAGHGKLEGRLFRLETWWPEASLSAEDWAFHMEGLAKKQPQDWRVRRQELHDYGKRRGFSSAPRERANDLSDQHGALPTRSPTAPTIATEEPPSASANGYQGTEDAVLAKWRALFVQHREEVASGKAVRLLHEAAVTHLGHGSARGTTPEERVASLVGKEQVDSVYAGIHRVVTEGSRIPKARAMAELCALDKLTSYDYILLVECHRLASSGVGFAKIRPDVVRSALAACHLHSWANKHAAHSLAMEQLEAIVFEDSHVAKQYFRDIVEPYLEKSARITPGIDVLCTRPGLCQIAGQLGCEWMKAFPGLRTDIFRRFFALAQASRAHTKIPKLVESKIKSDRWASPEERDNFMRAAFELDFRGHRRAIEKYASESKDRFWDLAESLMRMKDPTPDRIQFVLETFAPLWPPADHPGGLQVGAHQPWEASSTIIKLVGMLEKDVSDEATDALEHLMGSDRMAEYRHHIRQVRSVQGRRSFDLATAPLCLKEVRGILRKGKPVGHRHLQAIVMDALGDIEDHTRNSDDDELAAYWTAQGPRNENYCRDRIKAALSGRLRRHGISVSREASMPRENRADLLCQVSDELRVPIEIKRSMDDKVWTAPVEQLPKYARICGANRTAIFLVLWFGAGPGHQPAKCPFLEDQRPQSHRELKKLIDAWAGDVPYNLVTFVMDLSREKGDPATLGEAPASDRHPEHMSDTSEEVRR